VLELAFYGAEGHIYTSPARFVEEAGGRVLLHELAYSFFWEETGTETALAAPAKRITPAAEVEARFRLALAARGARLRLARPRHVPPASARPAGPPAPPRSPPPLPPPPSSDDDGF